MLEANPAGALAWHPKTASLVCRRQTNSLRYSRAGVRREKSRLQTVCTTAYSQSVRQGSEETQKLPKKATTKTAQLGFECLQKDKKISLGSAAGRNLSN